MKNFSLLQFGIILYKTRRSFELATQIASTNYYHYCVNLN